MRRWVLLLAVLLLLALAAAGLWLLGEPAAGEPRDRPSAPTDAPEATLTPPPRATPGARLVLRRQAEPAAQDAPTAPGEPAAIPAAALGPALKATFDDGLKVDLLGCVLDADLAPGFDGRLLFDLHLDATGLVDAAILDLSEVPQGLRDCVADQVWSTEWPRLTEGEVDVTYPVHLTVD